MDEVEKRIDAALKQCEAAAETIDRYGRNGLAALDNLRRLIEDIRIAYVEKQKCE